MAVQRQELGVSWKEYVDSLREADQRAVIIALEAQKNMMKVLAWGFSAIITVIVAAFAILEYFSTQ